VTAAKPAKPIVRSSFKPTERMRALENEIVNAEKIRLDKQH
jgi:hypothetical protein